MHCKVKKVYPFKKSILFNNFFELNISFGTGSHGSPHGNLRSMEPTLGANELM
jgi:hypothetical protein